MERTTTTIATGQNQGYYIRRWVAHGQGFLFFLATQKKRAGESNKGIFENFFKNFRQYISREEKKS